MRTLTQILKEADATNSKIKLKALAVELYDSQLERKPREVVFGLEHIVFKLKALDGKKFVEHLMNTE